MKRVRMLIEDYSIVLMAGVIVGLVWANIWYNSYYQVKSAIDFLVNEILMAPFFFLCGKEIRESFLPGGDLYAESKKEKIWGVIPKKAALPLFDTIGGMVGPVSVFVVCNYLFFSNPSELASGWAVVVATDIAFSLMVMKIIYPSMDGKKHAAISFIMLLAIADDALGLGILAAFYPQEVHNIFPVLHGVSRMVILAGGAAIAIPFALYLWKVKKVMAFWPYLLLPGSILWFSFHEAGIHPALALVPLAWCMPHEHCDKGFWAPGESDGQDTLNRAEHFLNIPVEVILGLFGFVNAGIEFTSVGAATGIIFISLVLGKPFGIIAFNYIGERFLGLQRPKGMNERDLIVVGFAAGIGFTVALFVSIIAFPEGRLQDHIKMGSLGSFGAMFFTLIIACVLKVGRFQSNELVCSMESVATAEVEVEK